MFQLAQAKVHDMPRIVIALLKSMITTTVIKNGACAVYGPMDFDRLQKINKMAATTSNTFKLYQECKTVYDLIADTRSYMAAYCSDMTEKAQLEILSNVEVESGQALARDAASTCVPT